MTKGGQILLTGATGTIGSWMAAEALRRGLRVVALVRGEDPQVSRQRLLEALQAAGVEDRWERVRVVPGDLCCDGLGLQGATDDLSDVSLICHCAAEVRFDENEDDLHERTNVQGTAAILRLAEALGAGFMHVSTAYVAGKRDGLAREDELDFGQQFNNAYERTKCLAEALVNDWSRQTKLPATILRPSIVLGDGRTGRTIHFNALYHFMRFFDGIATGRRRDEVRVLASATASKNIVPVDFVAAAAWELVSRGACGTYHLTHPATLTLSELCAIFRELFDTQRICLVGPDSFRRKPPTQLERAFMSLTRSYEAYMLSEPTFDRTNVDRALAGSKIHLPAIDLAYFRRLIAYARQVDWGRRPPLPSYRDTAAVGPSAFERYFGEFLAGKKDTRLLPDLHSLTATFQIIPAESPQEHWTLRVDQGVLTDISRNGHPFQCSFRVNAATFGQIVSGRLAPQHAFFRRLVEIDGDIETGLRVAAVLASFFRQFPFDPGV